MQEMGRRLLVSTRGFQALNFTFLYLVMRLLQELRCLKLTQRESAIDATDRRLALFQTTNKVDLRHFFAIVRNVISEKLVAFIGVALAQYIHVRSGVAAI